MANNPHHELIDQYAKDWKTNPHPWKLWEFFDSEECVWCDLDHHPLWERRTLYRRKVERVEVQFNGKTLSYPKPLTPSPGSGWPVDDDESLFFPSVLTGTVEEDTKPCDREGQDGVDWLDSCGMFHTTHKAAQEHLRVLQLIFGDGGHK